jgi:lipocalin
VILNRSESATGLRLLAGDGMRVPNYPHVLVAGLCDETDPEYDLRFDADEEYIRELIDRIDEMSLRGVRLCNRCTEKHRGKWQEKAGKA